MADRVTFGGSSGGVSGVNGNGSSGSSATRMQPSLAGFYDWSNGITGCVQVRQYHQTDQHQLYYQQQHQPQLEHAAGVSAQVFPARRPSKATLTKMRQYYNPGMKLLQAGRPPDAAWREASQLTKGERHLAMARQLPARMTLFDDPDPSANLLQPVVPRPHPSEGVSLCLCTYDPRLYPVYTSRSHGPMCVVCKQRRPGAGRLSHQLLNPHRDWMEEDANSEAAASAEARAADWVRAPPSTPRPGAGRVKMVSALSADGRKATLDIFLPNIEREPSSPLPRPSCDSARSQRTLSSPVPLFP